MSGPKVVRVVTREALVAQGESTLARLDQALQQWRDQCTRFDQMSAEDLEKVTARRDQLESLLRTDRFQEFTAGANGEISLLQSDMEARRAAAAEAKARERSRKESGRRSAQALAKALKAKDGDANKTLIASLERVATGDVPTAEVDRLLAQGIQSLSQPRASTLTEAQRELAIRLATGETAQTLDQWKAEQEKLESHQETIHRLISELSILGDTSAATLLETQLAALAQHAGTHQYALRLDSVLIESQKAKEHAISIDRLISELRLLASELSTANVDTASWQASVDRATHQRNKDELMLAANEGRNALSEALKAKAALARRQAILQGLAKLGYSVQEGMSTTLANEGRLVIKKPDLPGYGIEVAGGTANERLQVRTVALSASRDTSRDVDAESRWCQDFTKLQADLRTSGNELVIEKALPVGAVPLRVVELEVPELASSRNATPAAKGRQ